MNYKLATVLYVVKMNQRTLMTEKFIENFKAMFSPLKIMYIRFFKERNDQQHLFLQWYQVDIKKYETSLVSVLKYCKVTILL